MSSSADGFQRTFGNEAISSTVFLVVYTALFAWMVSGYITGRYKLRSRWSLLMFHCTVRVASEALGVTFGVISFSNINVFIAWQIMSAEGFFTITLSTYLFLKAWQKHNWGDSWLASDKYPKPHAAGFPLAFILVPILSPWRYKHHIMTPVHSILMPANAIIIAGGAMIASNADVTDTTSVDNATTPKILRTVGTAIFLAMVIFLNACIHKTIMTSRTSGSSMHPTLVILAIVGLFLIPRGAFGVLQACIYSLSYVNPSNYDATGYTNRFNALQYCLTVFPECCCAILLNMTYFTAKKDRFVNSADIPAESDFNNVMTPMEEKDNVHSRIQSRV